MAVFRYEGVSPSGQRVEGVVEAFDEYEALDKARATCRVVGSVKPVRQKPAFLQRELGSGRIKPALLAIMCRQFATVLDSGMSMARCAALVAEQTSDKNLKQILQDVAEDVTLGHSLASAFESKGADKLPTVFCETVRAGEAAGTLEASFESLHGYFDKRSKIRAKLVETLTYPSFVILLAIAVVAIMMIFVIPVFKELLDGYGGTMPLMTQIMINISDFFASSFIWMMLVIVAAGLGLKLWTKSDSGKEKWALFKLKVPVLGSIAQTSNAAMFANTLSLLLSSGLHMTHAVTVTSKVLDNYLISHGVAKMTAGLEEGKGLGACLEEVPFMPRPLIEMANVGEETGSLEQSLATMGAFYDEETERVTKRAIARLEPAVLIFIALFAGYIVIALYLAMFAIYGSM